MTSHAFDRGLSIWERLALRMHLAMCRVCRNYEQQLELIRAAFTRLRQRSGEQEALSPAARERIRRQLDEARR